VKNWCQQRVQSWAELIEEAQVVRVVVTKVMMVKEEFFCSSETAG